MKVLMLVPTITLFSGILAALHQQRADRGPPTKAVAILTTGNGQVHGSIQFELSNGTNMEHLNSGQVIVRGNITGLTPGEHGFHIHQFGDLTNGCTTAGPHYNPNEMTHGAPSNATRHVGDLGNIMADSKGIALFNITDRELQLSGTNSIIGRAVMVHALVDDLGQGTGEKAAESKKTGNAGARVACGIIGIAA